MLRRIAASLTVAGLFLAAPSARAFLIPDVTVVEFVNDGTGHYLLLTDAQEIAKVEAGGAGPYWRRTGYKFQAYVAGYLGQPVCRFYAYGPNSHFYTADAKECADLKADGRGWIYEKSDFAMDVPVAGSCGASMPVWRFYNDRWMFNDSNHRFTADPGQREAMRARGWIEEGVAFCTAWAVEAPAQLYAVATAQVRPSAECEDESINIGPCIALNQQPRLPNRIPGASMPSTGITSDLYTAQSPSDAAAVAAHSFVQAEAGSALQGVHVEASDRTSGDYTSINPLFQFRTGAPAAGEVDPRVFPWRDAGPNELVVSFSLSVRTIARGDATSAAYGHPTLEFIDAASGVHLYVTLQAYGTMDAGDFVARDTVTGRAIVSTAFRPDPAFGTRYAGQYARCQADAAGGTCPATGTDYRFGIDRAAFARVLALARTADARLSAEPADYLLRNFHFNNEVYREGRIGVGLRDFRLEIFDR